MQQMSTRCHYQMGGTSLKRIEILLCSDFLISLVIVISTLCVHIVHHADGQKIQITDGDTELYAAE